MKKLLLSGIALSALIAAPATAADLRMPTKAPPPPPIYFSWTGCYIGGNVGGVWVHKEVTGPVFGQTFSTDGSSALGGVQVGFNYQLPGGLVVGIQADYDWTKMSRDRNGVVLGVPFNANFHVKSVASVTGRIGYAWDRFLGYVKGGGAWERDDLTFTFPAAAASFSDTRSGWTIGVGGEYAFTNWLTGFIEYDHYDFGTRTNNVVCGPVACFVGAPGLFGADVKERKDVVKVGLNVLFGGAGGPVAARY